MGWAKRLGASRGLRSYLGWIGANYIRLVHATGAWTTVGATNPERFWSRGESFILAFWHGRLLMMPYCWKKGAPMRMLISQHRDGELIAETIRYFGLGTVRGSSRKGGGQAFRAMVKALKAGAYVGITPDGPRGPRMRAGAGAVSLARLSGAPILPATYAVSRRAVLGSWDRFVLAKPFARGVVLWGEPLYVSRDAEEAECEQARLELERRLNAITAEADRLVGAEPIAPAPGERTEEAW